MLTAQRRNLDWNHGNVNSPSRVEGPSADSGDWTIDRFILYPKRLGDAPFLAGLADGFLGDDALTPQPFLGAQLLLGTVKIGCTDFVPFNTE